MNEDTIKQVIVMRTDLGMRKGKMIAQGAHASMAFLAKHVQGKSELTDAAKEWLAHRFTKICVRADSKEELEEIILAAKESQLEVYPIYDSGLTEFNNEVTLTCCAIGPDYSSKIDQVTGNQKLL